MTDPNADKWKAAKQAIAVARQLAREVAEAIDRRLCQYCQAREEHSAEQHQREIEQKIKSII